MRRARLLVVDDEPGMLRTVDRIASSTHEVVTARLPSQALERAEETPFEVALLDVRMPEMDGFALMARLQEIQPDLDVILMTGSADERDERLVRAIREKAFFFLTKPFDREVLLTLIERCLEVRRLNDENRLHVRRLEGELEAARQFQDGLLPERSLQSNGLDLALHWEPSVELGGDFADYVAVAGGAALVIADVSGHGGAAAMLTGMVKLAFRAARTEDFDPAAVCRRLAEASAAFPEGRFVSALAVRVDPARGRLEYVNAGHPAGLLVRPDGTLTLLESSLPFFYRDLALPPILGRSLPFDSGDRLVLVTDGVLEARDPAGAEFGPERLEQAVCEGRSLAALALIGRLRADIRAHAAGRPGADDLTIVAVAGT